MFFIYWQIRIESKWRYLYQISSDHTEQDRLNTFTEHSPSREVEQIVEPIVEEIVEMITQQILDQDAERQDTNFLPVEASENSLSIPACATIDTSIRRSSS